MSKEERTIATRADWKTTDMPAKNSTFILSREFSEVVQAFRLMDEEYRSESVAFMVENGEKEYSFEVAGIYGEKIDVLWRYTIGGSDRVHKYFEPKLISLDIE